MSKNLKQGDKVKINYNKLKINYKKNIEKRKKYPLFNETLAIVRMSNEIGDMKKFDKENGNKRIIKSISYHDYLGKKIARFTLDNGYVYLVDELIKK